MPRKSKILQSSVSQSQIPQSKGTKRIEQKGRPRLDAYQRLQHRFYESLIMLKVLAPAQKGHLSIVEDSFGLQLVRRRFLRNLAFVCDFKKGRETTTAIGVEERYDIFKFWVGSNVYPAKKIAPFLRSVLTQLKENLHPRENERRPAELAFFRICINFARSRVVKEGKLLMKAVKRCQTHLGNDGQESCMSSI